MRSFIGSWASGWGFMMIDWIRDLAVAFIALQVGALLVFFALDKAQARKRSLEMDREIRKLIEGASAPMVGQIHEDGTVTFEQGPDFFDRDDTEE